MSMLEQALSHSKPRSHKGQVSDELVELALAWAKDEISYTQAQYAYNKSKGIEGTGGMTAYVALARALREAVKRGKLVPA